MGFSHFLSFAFGIGLGVYVSENYNLDKARNIFKNTVTESPELRDHLEKVKRLEQELRKGGGK